MPVPKQRLDRGVTLAELLVVLMIVSIALAIVAPAASNSYQNWILRSAGRRTTAFFRLASYTARRDGTDLAAYYSDHRFVLLRQGTIVRELTIPSSIRVQPNKPQGAFFLQTGQILAAEPFVLENERRRTMIIEAGPLPGQVRLKEVTP